MLATQISTKIFVSSLNPHPLPIASDASLADSAAEALAKWRGSSIGGEGGRGTSGSSSSTKKRLSASQGNNLTKYWGTPLLSSAKKKSPTVATAGTKGVAVESGPGGGYFPCEGGVGVLNLKGVAVGSLDGGPMTPDAPPSLHRMPASAVVGCAQERPRAGAGGGFASAGGVLEEGDGAHHHFPAEKVGDGSFFFHERE